MRLRAIIIDDEQKGIDTLNLLIEMFIKEVKVVAHSTNATTSLALIENYKPEIVFLDINMPEMNGFELLEKLNWKDFNLIFTTAHQEYAIRAIKNNAIDYLLKPIDYEDLLLAVERIKKQLSSEVSVSKFNYSELL
ncbi:MAG: two component transcriptional regulator, LytTR family, partial [Segetibacter sp.]|nr:two component transcriptional regulator, LytTR family [Segetibacter sp.]